MTETKHKEHITSEHFGIPADFADRAENYAARRVQALSEQLAEAQALIDASRNQEPVAWKYTHVQSGYTDISLDHPEKMNEWNDMQLWHTKPLFAAPVVAPDVLKDAERYQWLRSKTLLKTLPIVRVQIMNQGTYALQQGKELDAAIDDMGGAND